MKANYSSRFEIEGRATSAGFRLVRVCCGSTVVYVPFDAVSFDNKTLDRHLSWAGLMTTGPERTDLLARISQLHDFPPVRGAERSGWHDTAFVFEDGEICLPESDSAPFEILFTPRSVRQCRGTAEEWNERIGRYLIDNPFLMFSAMVAFVGPLLALVDRSTNILFELAGASSCGKSKALQIAASIWGRSSGRPSERYWKTCNGTVNAIEDTVRGHQDALLCLDELQLLAAGESDKVRGKTVGELIFRLSEGETKGRLGEPVFDFNLATLFTANQRVRDLVGGTRSDVADAIEVRLCTLPIDADRPYGIIDHVPERFTGSRQFIDFLVRQTEEVYGSPSRQFMRRLTAARANDEPKLRQRIRREMKAFYDQLGIDPNDGLRGRAVEAFGLTSIAGRMAKHWGALPKGFDPTAIAIECYKRHALASSREASAVDVVRAYAARTAIIDLDKGFPELTDAELRAAPGFTKTCKGVRCLLVMSDNIEKLFPAFGKRKNAADIGNLLMPEPGGGRNTVKERLSVDPKKWRVYRFRLAS